MAELTVNKGDRYTTDSLFQWDLGQVLEIHGLSLSSDPEIHFTTEVLNGAIVRQATRDDKGIISVKIPNSLLQKQYKIDVFICVYEGDTFQTLYKMSIPIIPRKRPFDYTLEDTDEEIYSFNALENKLHETLKTLTLITDEALLDLQKSGAENLASVNQKADETLARLEQIGKESVAQLTETCNEAVETVNHISNFAAKVGFSTAGTIMASRTNPADAKFKGVRILSKIGGYPTSPTDGNVFYNSNDAVPATFFTKSGFVDGTWYYLRAFAYTYQNATRLYTTTEAGAQENGVPLQIKGQQIFTSSGIFTVPAGVTSLDVFLVGGTSSFSNAGANFTAQGGKQIRTTWGERWIRWRWSRSVFYICRWWLLVSKWSYRRSWNK